MQSTRRKSIRHHIQTSMSGSHMLAFLPALCLSAYWTGGELFLVSISLFVPLLYAATGGFGASLRAPHDDVDHAPSLKDIADDFLKIAQHNGQTTACFQLAVTGFEDIARTLGEEAAEDARKLIKDRMLSTLRSGDYVFQTGENRYVVLISPGFRLKLDSLIDLGKRLRSAVEDPIFVAGATRYLSVSIGVASSLNFARNATVATWLASSAQALGEATANGPTSMRIWSEKLSHASQARRTLRVDLSKALAKGEIQAHFQPQISVRTGEVIGMEALARWQHPVRGTIGPSEFLRALHDSGEMEQLCKIMLAQALSALRTWDEAGFVVPSVSINMASVELRNPTLADHIAKELDRFGLPAHRLGIEVMEDVICDANDVIRRNLSTLAKTGCRIDLDDFGTGQTSIATLQDLPIQRIKIDQRFVKGAHADVQRKKTLSVIVRMAHQLGFETLAEGVETVAQCGVLQDLGCEFAQGFLWAKAMERDACLAWLQDQQPKRSMAATATIRRVK